LASSSSSSRDYAGFWLRAVALLIDWLVVAVVYGTLVVIAANFFSLEQPFPAAWEIASMLVLAGSVLFFWRVYGATPGKIAVAARIVDAETGQAPSTGRLIVRLVSYIVSALPFYLGFFWAAFDRRKQAWHDKIAGTVVILDD
jgi:uncharacterized RDD family membrane protein YckC